MEGLKAPSLQSLLESDKGCTDSLLAESLHLDFEDLDDVEYSIPVVDKQPTLESVLSELEFDSDIGYEDPTNTVPTSTSTMNDGFSSKGCGGGSLLRHVILQGVSTQIGSAADRINAGIASAVAISHMIGIGTSHGHILNFDNTQTLKWAYQDQNSQGAVTDLAYNESCTRLLTGFARGLIIMIDTNSGDVLRNLFDAVTPNTGVLSIKWTGCPALALCSDSGGSLWSLSFTRKLGVRGCASRCLFSGARGEVCAIEPLILDNGDITELKSYSIVALATLSKYFVVTIRPRLKVIKFYILNGPSGCLPLFAWQMVLIQAADTSRTIDPVLAVARGYNLYFHQIVANGGRINILYLRHVQLTCNFLALHWLGPKSLACIDQSEILHLIDVRTSKELESIDLANIGLVYGSAQFKGLATGGNVSPALALAGTYACYSSIVSYGTQLYILGSRNLNMIGIRSWNERITYLINNQRWVEACDLAIDGFRNAGDRKRRKQKTKERIIQLFYDYLAKNHRNTIEFCLGPIMKCLIEINELNLIWNDLWDRLDSQTTFLTLLTEHIENDDIKIINPTITQALIDFWLNISFKKVEEIILKLDWICLDLNQVLNAVKKYKLYKAQIYLNSQALNDYTVPLIELIPLINIKNNEKERHCKLGNYLLVYISCCLAGRGYPSGDIPVELVANVKHDIIRCLTSTHSSNCTTDNELPYPYLRELLKFDTRETLNVLALAFEEKEFCNELGLSQRKRIIYILLEIMTPDNATWSQIGCLLNFISQQISTKSLPYDSQLLDEIVNYLMIDKIDGETQRQHFEREQAWLELLSSNHLNHIDLNNQLKLAKNAKCYYVAEFILENLKQYDNILDCYLLDENRYLEIFTYIENYSKISERKTFQQLLKNVKKILKIDSERTAKIISDNYSDRIDEFIQAILIEDQNNMKKIKEDSDDASTSPSSSNLLYEFLTNAIKYGIQLNSDQYELYLNLLCEMEPDKVKEFLITNDCRLKTENALNIVNKYKLIDCCIYLYEKQGDYQMAFNLSFDMLKESSSSTSLSNLQSSEQIALQLNILCSRVSLLLTNEQKFSDYWLPFIKLILKCSDLQSITRVILCTASQHVDLTKLIELVLNYGTQSGNIGDIKQLLIDMLSNSKYETLLMKTTSNILGHDLHMKFKNCFKNSKKGIWITLIKCCICRQKLYNQTLNNDDNNSNDIIIFGGCSHSVHENCIKNLKLNNNSCPRCGNSVDKKEPIVLSKPSLKIINDDSNSSNSNFNLNRNNNHDELQLKAPPRKF